MKHVILSIVATFIVLTATAQIEKGTTFVGANSNIGYNSFTPTSGGSSESIFNIGVKTGYFVANNFTVGFNLEYLNESGSGSSSTSFTTIGFFLRYYADKVFLGAGYNSISASSGGSSSPSFGSVPIEIGYAAFVTRNIAIEPALVYTMATDSDNGAVPGLAGIPFPAKSSFGIRVGFSIYLGRPAE